MAGHSDAKEKTCPLAAVDRRLEDAHRLWHQAEQSYFDPEAFRLAAQGTIQTLRTVTFILQNHKHVIPDFDGWYRPWQERLKADALMRWMVDARNKIEKQGDLEAQSFVRAEIIASYLDEGPGIEVPAELFDDPGVLLRRIPEGAVRRHVMENGTLRVQRRWVENSLPDHELLDALAVAYGRLAEVVHDAHRQMGLPAPSTVNVDTKQRYDRSDMKWRMPCMIGHEEPRSLLISLSDGSILSFGQETICFDPDKAEEVKARYGNVHEEAMGQDHETYDELAAAYFGMVRNVFLRDGYHLPFLFLFKERKLVGMVGTPAEDQQQKYLLMRSLAHEATRRGADAALAVDEAWFAAAKDVAPYQRPSEVETRREALTLTLVTAGDTPAVQYVAEIKRDGDKVSLGETSVSRGGAAFTFAPFYVAWGRPIPQEWLEWEKWAAEAEAEDDK